MEDYNLFRRSFTQDASGEEDGEMAIGSRWVTLLMAGMVSLIPFWDLEANAQQPRSISVMAYRTEISPSSPEEDALFVSRLVPHLARLMFGDLTGNGFSYETIDVQINRRFAVEEDGSYVTAPSGRKVVDADTFFTIRGDQFYAATLAYLGWRLEFEKKWIHDASPESVELELTPLQMIGDNPDLSELEKIGQILVYYQLHQRQSSGIQEKIPDPDYWPVSPVFDIDAIGVQVQFNIRGGVVTVLHSESSRVWQLPFPVTGSCDRWLRLYERHVNSSGLEKAAEEMKEEVMKWN